MIVTFRASSVGKLMAEAKSIAPELLSESARDIQKKHLAKRTPEEAQILDELKRRTLSEGAKTYIRDLVKEDIYGTDFSVSTKYMDKGIAVEDESIAMLNRVRGLALTKNTERRTNGYLTGECDLVDLEARRGHDVKSAWDLSTFPAFAEDARCSIYEWQMRAYMHLWDCDEWEVNHCMVSTPEELIGKFDRYDLHMVDHIPEHHRITTWKVKRDLELESLMLVKLEVAAGYYLDCLRAFDQDHQPT